MPLDYALSISRSSSTRGGRFEIVGYALKRLPSRATGRNQRKPAFGGRRNKGRRKVEGWTLYCWRTVVEHLERHRAIWQSALHIKLRANTDGESAKAIFRHFQRWLRGKGISAVGVAETPNPHFHVAISIPYSDAAGDKLRRSFRGWWMAVYGGEPPEDALMWEARDEPLDAIAPYLSKRDKAGKLVKGKARWLTFTPYFTTRLPKMARHEVYLTDAEAKDVRVKPFRMTFGAGTRLNAVRAARSRKPAAAARSREDVALSSAALAGVYCKRDNAVGKELGKRPRITPAIQARRKGDLRWHHTGLSPPLAEVYQFNTLEPNLGAIDMEESSKQQFFIKSSRLPKVVGGVLPLRVR